MNFFTATYTAHPVMFGVAGMWLVSNAINAMPTPKPAGGAFYDWCFKFCQPLGAAIPRLLAIYSPDTLTALTGQTVKQSQPPNPPAPAGEQEQPVSLLSEEIPKWPSDLH